MILHLVEDEKIINRTYALFEKVRKGQNKFLIDIPNDQYKLKYIQNKNCMISAVYGSEKYWSIVGDISQYEVIVLHYLTENKCKFIIKYQDEPASFLWILWGADLYNYLAEAKGYKLYLWKPTILNFKLRWLFIDKLNTKIRKIKDILNGIQNSTLLYKKAYIRIDYCGIFNKGDYDLLINNTKSNSKWLWFNYYPIDTILGEDLIKKKVSGDNIIIGNSGSTTGNHIPAFKILKSFNIEDKKIIVPLSYGNPSYCQYVIKKGNKFLGDKFNPIQNFMPLHEYNNLLCSASIVIMFQLRQEAVGNILVSLYLGAKVYLREENNLYSYFNSIGVKVFSINNDLNLKNKEALKPLSEDNQIQNRKIILSEFNETRILSKTNEMLLEAVK